MKNIIIVLTILSIATYSYGKGKKYTYSDTTFNHIEFAEITFTLDKKTLDTLHIEGLLKQKTIIDGVPCYGKISFHKDWELQNFIIADIHTFGKYSFPKDTYVGLDIDRFDLKTHYLVMAGADFVNICKFPHNLLINGFSCDSIEDVIFTTDWNLRACILGTDDNIKGNVLNKGTLVVFGKNGSFSIYCLYDPIIQGYHIPGSKYTSGLWGGGGGIHFYPDGRLKYFRPIDDIEVQGVYCKSSSLNWGISLYESGKLKKCTSANEQTIGGVLYKKKFILEFDEEGNVIKSKKDKFF